MSVPRPSGRSKWPELPDVPESDLRENAIRYAEVVTPMYALFHVLGGTPVVGLGFPGAVLAALCGWILVPVVALCTVALSVLAIWDRELRSTVPYSVLILLCMLMVHQILRALV